MCNRILFLLSAECSLIAIEKDTKRIVGLNIMRIMEHSDYGWFDTLFIYFFINMSTNIYFKDLLANDENKRSGC